MITNFGDMIEPLELITPFDDVWQESVNPAEFCDTGIIVTCQKGWKR